MPTKIKWVRNPDGTQGETWNPIVGCSHASAGCANCYAETVAATRLLHHPLYKGITANGRWTGEIRLDEKKLEAPLRWRKPRVIFVSSMGDLFYKKVPFEWVAEMFVVMAKCRQHQFIILTKRPDRMRFALGHASPIRMTCGRDVWCEKYPAELHPNIVLGVSVEDQGMADERIPLLLDTPAAKRIVSYEPALGAVDFWSARYKQANGSLAGAVTSWKGCGVDGIIAGPETGPGKRPADLDWFRSARDQCAAAGVPFFYKAGELDGVRHEAMP